MTLSLPTDGNPEGPKPPKVVVTDTKSLIEAVTTATSGEAILVAPGSYSGVALSNINNTGKNIVIRSEFATSQATFTDLTLANSTGISFADLTFSTVGDQAGPFGAANTNEFQILNDKDIVLSHLDVHGDPNGKLPTAQSGFLIRDSQHVILQNSELSYLHYAVGHLGDTGLYIRDNYFHNIYDDGVRGGGSSSVLIRGNYFTDFHMDPTDTDHPDAIQFWTVNTTNSAKNINISDNLYVRGDGGLIQGIFIQQNNNNTPYMHLVIENNDLAGTGYNGIATGGSTNSSISARIMGNILESFAAGQTFISVSDSVNALLENNSAPEYLNSANINIQQVNEQVSVPVTDSGAALQAEWMAANPAFESQFSQAVAFQPVASLASVASAGASASAQSFAASMASFGAGNGVCQETLSSHSTNRTGIDLSRPHAYA